MRRCLSLLVTHYGRGNGGMGNKDIRQVEGGRLMSWLLD